ncbi:MAG: sigma-70 family RNA polymerase sigma factor [Oscillospiraceae bacterium]|nr:sigma-70 family RNA polymerase sigma factor [Oscillospiraceae bacterium]
MSLSPADKKRIRQQFDSLAKKVLSGEANSYKKEITTRAKREITFSDLSEAELDKLLTVDEYSIDTTHYNVNGFDIAVRDDLLAEALNALPDHKREIILMAYFLDMSDAEIAALFQNNRKTIYKHRMTGLDLLKNLMKEESPNDEKNDQ